MQRALLLGSVWDHRSFDPVYRLDTTRPYRALSVIDSHLSHPQELFRAYARSDPSSLIESSLFYRRSDQITIALRVVRMTAIFLEHQCRPNVSDAYDYLSQVQ